jgi:hypothetical protein
MKPEKIVRWELIILALSIVSTFLFHQLYDWLGGLIAPINESVWDHGKLIFFPFLLFSVVEMLFLKPENKCNFWAIKFLAAMLGTLTMTTAFYLYSGILGTNYLIADILTGFIGVFVSFYISYTFLKNNKQLKHCGLIIMLGLILTLLFFVFTFTAPNISWFIPSS